MYPVILCIRFPGLNVDHLGSVIHFPNICFFDVSMVSSWIISSAGHGVEGFVIAAENC